MDLTKPRRLVDRWHGPGLLRRIKLTVGLSSDEVVSWRSLGALFLAGGFLTEVAIPLAPASGSHLVLVALIGADRGVDRCNVVVESGVAARAVHVLGVGVRNAVDHSGGDRQRSTGRPLQPVLHVGDISGVLLSSPSRGEVALGVGRFGVRNCARSCCTATADQWVLVFGTLVTTAWLIGVLRARVERFARLARTDGLTGLANRRGFDEDIELALEDARHERARLSLVLIDLDRLKAVNDRHGHLEGDAVLCRFAQLCAETVDPAVARLGGDEFAIIASDTDPRAAAALAHRIHTAVRSDPALAGHAVTISIGIATFPGHADSSRSLLHAADRALYRAKQSGRDQVVSYGPLVENDPTLDKHMRESSSHLDAVILLSETLDLRDVSTSAHSQTVARYAAMIAERTRFGCRTHGADPPRRDRPRPRQDRRTGPRPAQSRVTDSGGVAADATPPRTRSSHPGERQPA